MNTTYKSKRKQIIKKIATYSMLLMLSLNLAFLEKNTQEENKDTIKEEKIQKIGSDSEGNLRAYEYVKKQDYINASKAFLSVIKHTSNPTNTNEQLAYAYVNRAWSLNKLGKKEQSLLILEEFLSIFKDSPSSYIQESVSQTKDILHKYK